MLSIRFISDFVTEPAGVTRVYGLLGCARHLMTALARHIRYGGSLRIAFHRTPLLIAVLLAFLNPLFSRPQCFFGCLAGKADEGTLSLRCDNQIIAHEPALQVKDRCGISPSLRRDNPDLAS